MKINEELKAKWVEALRSGRYKQGTRFLRKGDAFCCLGVLCDVSGLGEWKKPGPWDEYVVEGDALHSVNYLAESLARTIGIDSGSQKFLAKMNDGLDEHSLDEHIGLPVSFSVIADWIEENL